MFDISGKIETLRTATAESWVLAKPESIRRVMTGDTPKGDVLTVAKVSAILAAKKTPELIPYCHPLSLDHLEVSFAATDRGLQVLVTAKTVSKTGVEMEAMTAASFAALTVYDMMKNFDKEVVIGETRLVKKKGGKSDFVQEFPRPKRAAILVTSDSVAAGKKEDRSGKLIQEAMAGLPVEVEHYQVVPDEPDQIRAQLLAWIEGGTELILTTGGTGLGPRDVTAAVINELSEQEVPGVAEAMRAFGQRRTPYAMLSRSTVGIHKGTILIALPGSSKGVQESIQAIFPAVLHAFNMMKGGGH